MTRRTILPTLALLLTTATVYAQPPVGDDLDELLEKAIRAAVQKASPSIVQIETTGGTDIISTGPKGAMIRKGTGPTTGIVVGTDGWIISSAFNFANKPSAVFVSVPNHKERYVAKVVATDTTRMLTLLQVPAKNLPMPVAAPKKEFRVGQTCAALGRTWVAADMPPSMSVGIVSALGRVWGKAIQTDAKVSPVNYGGPLIDLQGRVIGVLVPASPRSEGETAGVEWYDSGIGFAIPLEDVFAVLPRMQKGQDLKRGLLGVTPKHPDTDFASPPEIASVAPESAAARGGIKPGDVLVELDGKPVANMAQVRHALGPKYEGDPLEVKVQRGKDVVTLPKLTLTASITAFVFPFLGVVPMRDDPEVGEEVRYVFPKSPADIAGIKAGDRIMKIGMSGVTPQPFSGRDQLTQSLGRLPPGTELTLEVVRKEGGKTETVKAKLGTMPDAVPESLPAPASRKKALEPRKNVAPPKLPLDQDKKEPPKKEPPKKVPPKKDDKKEDKKEDKKKAETGVFKRANVAGDHEYWMYVPADYDPNVAYSLVVWLHPAGKGRAADIKATMETWEDFCIDHHLIFLAPRADADTGWTASDADNVLQDIREVLGQYTIDRSRIVAHGMGKGGELAFYLAFNAREFIRGVATTGAVLNSQAKPLLPEQRVAFYVAVGDKDPLLDAIKETHKQLTQHKYPVTFRTVPNLGHQYLEADQLRELVRWIDALDRQ